MIKIALCLSGQPRGLPVCLDIIKKALIQPNTTSESQVDIFLHSWFNPENVGQPYNSAQPSQNGGKCGFVKEDTDKILKNNLKPIKWLIEPQKDFAHAKHLPGESSAIPELLCSNFYSTYISNELKKQHEQEQDFIYDIVIRTRYDLFYFHPIKVLDYINQIQENKIVVMKKFQEDQDNKNNSNKPMVDIFAVGNSKTIDIFCGVYPKFVELSEKCSPAYGENILGMHTRIDNNIELYKADLSFDILHRILDLSKQ